MKTRPEGEAVCLACGKRGHGARRGPAPWEAYLCPKSPNPFWWGATGTRRPDGHCSECGNAVFAYDNGAHYSKDGVRGYRCRNPDCGAVKPEPTEAEADAYRYRKGAAA